MHQATRSATDDAHERADRRRGDCHRREARRGRRRVEVHRVHPVRVQLRHRGAARRRRTAGSLVRVRGDDAHPASRGYACEKPLRLDFYQNGPHRLTKPLRRRSDGSFEEIDWDTAIREVAARFAAIRDTYGGESIFYYGGGGQGNHLPGAYGRSDARGARLDPSLERARAGEDRRVLGRRQDGRRLHARRLRALRGGAVPRQEPLVLAQHPARPRHAAGDRQGPAPLSDRGRSAPHRDRRARRHPPPGEARAPTRGCSRRCSACWCRRDLLARDWLAVHADGLERGAAALRRACRSRSTAPRAACRRSWCATTARRIAAASSVATFEDLGVQMNRHSTLVSYLHKLLVLLTGNFGKKGAAYLPDDVRSARGRQGGRWRRAARARR